MTTSAFETFTTIFRTTTAVVLAMSIAACGGGGGGSSDSQVVDDGSSGGDSGGGTGAVSLAISGGGVKGPLANADVTAYLLDTSAPDFRGAQVATATTNDAAAITGLALPFPLNAPYILDITSNSGTTDITTGLYPVITEMSTVVRDEMLTSGQKIYATPLTSMALRLAVKTADANLIDDGDGGASISENDFLQALENAAAQVTSTLGFGLRSNVDIFDTPPLVNEATDTAEEQADMAAYRSAVEAVTAIVYEMDQQSAGTNPDEVLLGLADDLSDGEIDGKDADGDTASAEALNVLDQDPTQLPIPNTSQTVADVTTILSTETTTTGATTDTTALATVELDVRPAETDPDIDNDGVPNVDDAFPADGTESVDTDGDGIGNNADTDDDNDGVADTLEASTACSLLSDCDGDGTSDLNDAFPTNANETTDSDGDGTGDVADTDDDNDGVPDTSDDFPKDASRSSASDLDNDGLDAAYDPDDTDATNPGAAYTFVDTDGDGVPNDVPVGSPNPADNDDDNDGVSDALDAFPLIASEQSDLDGDGTGDNSDTDVDGDGINNDVDAFPRNPNETVDTDDDGIGDNADADDDNDKVADVDEAAGCELKRDCDGDGYFDNIDAFPANANEALDTDGDGIGNNADTDDDGDGLSDDAEVAAGTKPLVTDTDGDGVNDGSDLFPTDDTEALDNDGDGIGDNTDTDDDNDGSSDANEVTAGTDPKNPDSDGDGANDGSDAFPTDSSEWLDTDGDTIGNNADTDDDGDGVEDAQDAFPLDASRFDINDQDNDGWDAAYDPDDSVETGASNPGIPFIDTDGDGVPDTVPEGSPGTADTDDDNDGVADTDDAFPTNPNETLDTDGDTVGNNADDDDDGDGTPDVSDAFPLNKDEDSDADGDGIGDNADADDDNDGVRDDLDAFPNDPTESKDLDGDGIGDNSDLDVDGDSVNNDVDAFPRDKSEDSDADGDGVGDNSDTDDDNDGVPDGDDAFPNDATASRDTDNDGMPDTASAGTTLTVDDDDDNDGTPDTQDLFPLDPSETSDNDNDGVGDNADLDDDNDGVADLEDAFPTNSDESLDTDGDGTGNNADTDDDADGTPDASDAFPLNKDEDTDTDGDGIGNNADTDDDGDGVADVDESTLGTDPLIADTDGDTHLDGADNCPVDANSDQANNDQDLLGDVCDPDDDNDNVLDTDEVANGTNPLLADTDLDTVNDDIDNCPLVSNTNQSNVDGDSFGDVCDNDGDNDGLNADVDPDDTNPDVDGDGTLDGADAFPLDPSEQSDTDGDGVGDNADVFPTDPNESADTDGDTVGDNGDNCPAVANTDQLDTNGNGVGAACEAIPVATGQNVSISEDSSLPITLTAGSDVEGDSLTFALVALPQDGLLEGTLPNVTYVPTANFNGADGFTFTVSDGEHTSVEATIAITVTPVNDLPVAINDSVTVQVSQTVTIDVLANDSDVADGDTLTIISASASSGTVSINAAKLDYTAPATAGSDTISYTISDGNGGFDTATVGVTVQEAPVVIDLTGVWKGIFTIDSLVDVTSLGCTGEGQVGDVAGEMYFSFDQSGYPTLTVTEVSGVVSTGTVDESTGVITNVVGNHTGSEPDGSYWDDLITMNGISDGNTISATVVNNLRSYAADTSLSSACDVTFSVAMTKVYEVTGTEAYSGTYGFEVGGQAPDGSDIRGTNVVHMEFANGLVDVQGAEEFSGYRNMISSSFDATTGVFQFTNVMQEAYDENGDGFDDLEQRTMVFSGLMIAAPNDMTGATTSSSSPSMVFKIMETGEMFNGDASTSYVHGTPVDTTGLTPVSRNDYEMSGYGQIRVPTVYTRNKTLEDGSNKVVLGLLDAPLMRTTSFDKMGIVVKDATGATLCKKPYDGSLQYKHQPYVDMTTESFAGPYNSVSCASAATAAVLNNADIVVGVVEMGPDGVLGTADDIPLSNYSGKAAITTPPSESLTLGSVEGTTTASFNGSNQLCLDGSGALAACGYFNPNASLNVTWEALTATPNEYVLRVQDRYPHSDPQMLDEYRFTTSGTGTSGTAHSMDINSGMNVSLRAVYTDTDPAIGISESNAVAVNYGVLGTWEVYDSANNYRFDVTAELSDSNASCSISDATYLCVDGWVNHAQNQVSLHLTDAATGTMNVTVTGQFSPLNAVSATWTDTMGQSGTMILKGATPPPSFTYEGVAIDADVILAEGYADVWSESGSKNDYFHDLLTWDGSTSTYVEKYYDFASSAWTPYTIYGDPQKVLDPATGIWVSETQSMEVTSASAANAQIQMDGGLRSYTVSFTAMDIAGMSLLEVPVDDDTWQNSLSTGTYSTGARLVEVIASPNIDIYTIDAWSDCADPAATGDNCNVVKWYNSMGVPTTATTLEELQTTDPANPSFVEIGWDEQSNMGLIATLNNDGSMDFYESDGLSAPALVTGVTPQTWQIVTVGSVDLLTFGLAPELSQYDEGAPGVKFIAIEGGYARRGWQEQSGVTITKGIGHNSVALTDLLANVTPVESGSSCSDTDMDGICDADESMYGTDPSNPDSDGDGLSDGEEVNTYSTNPVNSDSDGDGISDGDEVNSSNTDPTNPDSDGDGVNDGLDPAPNDPSVTGQLTFLGSPVADMEALMASGFGNPESWTDCCDATSSSYPVYEYGSVVWDGTGYTSINTTEQWYEFDTSIHTDWSPMSEGSMIVLDAASGWVTVSEAKMVSASSTANVTVTDVLGGNYENFTITANEMDISARGLTEVPLPQEWATAVASSGATYSTGARWLELSVTDNIESHHIDFDDCPDAATLGGNCNVVPVSVNGGPISNAVTLADVLSDATNTRIAGVGEDYSTGMMLLASFNPDSSITFFEWDGDMASAPGTLSSVGGTWAQTTVNTVDMVTFNVPPELSQYEEVAGQPRLLSVHDGYVRHGWATTIGGEPKTFMQFNGIAINDLVTNFTPDTGGGSTSPLNELIGAWTTDPLGGIGDNLAVFFENGEYMQWVDLTVVGATGCGGDTSTESEVGTFTYDGSQLTITSHLQNGVGGFDNSTNPCAIPEAPLNVTISDGTLTFDDFGVTFYRVTDAANPIVGAWSQDFAWGTSTAWVQIFFANGASFNWCDKATRPDNADCTTGTLQGIEIGTYQWNVSGENLLDIGAFVRDDNPEFFGLSSFPNNPTYLYVNVDCIWMPLIQLGLKSVTDGAACGSVSGTVFNDSGVTTGTVRAGIFTDSTLTNRVACAVVDATSNSFSVDYLSEGTFYVGAYVDANDNLIPELSTEPFTVYPDLLTGPMPITVSGGTVTSGINMTITPP